MASVQQSGSLSREFFVQQAPLIFGALILGFVTAFVQHGFLPGGDRAFPLAEVRVPIWHIIWMGMWTGYTMAIVGEAAGIFALPYTMSILQFTNQHVTPSTQLLTFLNPIGALLGFRRTGQWNLDFAAAVCLGGVVGGLTGPFLRSTLLAAAGPFRFTLGLALAFVGVHMFYKVLRGTPARKSPAAAYAMERIERTAEQNLLTPHPHNRIYIATGDIHAYALRNDARPHSQLQLGGTKCHLKDQTSSSSMSITWAWAN